MSTTLCVNDVYRVPVAEGVVARIRVQRRAGWYETTFRAEPDKGDADEAAALAAIEVLKGYFEARGRMTRSYFRRHRNGEPGAFTDVLDAVTVQDRGIAENPIRTLLDFQLIASSRIH